MNPESYKQFIIAFIKPSKVLKHLNKLDVRKATGVDLVHARAIWKGRTNLPAVL